MQGNAAKSLHRARALAHASAAPLLLTVHRSRFEGKYFIFAIKIAIHANLLLGCHLMLNLVGLDELDFIIVSNWDLRSP